MSLLQQLVDSIGGDFFEGKSSSDSPKNLNPAADADAPQKQAENRDDSSSTKERKKDAMVITNLSQSVNDYQLVVKSAMSDDCSASNSSVSFGSVQVREYERVIDSTNIYMGLALGWNYNDKVPTPVKEKNKTIKYSGSASHGGEESRMKRTNGSDRYGMMMRYGYAQRELKQATKEAAQFYKQRQREAARSIVVAEERTKQGASNKPKRRPLLRSMFG